MDASVFAKMLSDQECWTSKKWDINTVKEICRNSSHYSNVIFIRNYPCMTLTENRWYTWKVWRGFHCRLLVFLLTPQQNARLYGTKAMEEEILSTFRIEQIDTSRESVRRIFIRSGTEG